MANVFEEVAERTTRLHQLFNEVSTSYFPPDNISSIGCYKLTESIGVKLQGDSPHTAVIDSLPGEVRLFEDEDGLLSCQIGLRQDRESIHVSLGNAPNLCFQPQRPQKSALPGLIKSHCWNYVILAKSFLEEVLQLAGRYKTVQRGPVTFYLDESLEWLIEDGVETLKVYGKSDKFGLLKEIRDRLKNHLPETVLDNVKNCIGKEIDVLKSVEFDSFTAARRSLIPLEANTDLAVQELLTCLS